MSVSLLISQFSLRVWLQGFLSIYIKECNLLNQIICIVYFCLPTPWTSHSSAPHFANWYCIISSGSNPDPIFPTKQIFATCYILHSRKLNSYSSTSIMLATLDLFRKLRYLNNRFYGLIPMRLGPDFYGMISVSMFELAKVKQYLKGRATSNSNKVFNCICEKTFHWQLYF